MKSFLNLLVLSCFLFTNAFAAGVPFKPQADEIIVGKDASTDDKKITINVGDGVTNPKIEVDNTTKRFELNKGVDVTGTMTTTGNITSSGNVSGVDVSGSGNLAITGTGSIGGNVTIGTGVGASKSITINKGGSNPYLKWDNTNSKWVFSNDGTVEKAIGSGGGGAGAFSFIQNGGFEDGINLGWEFSGGTVTATNAANALIELISAVFNPAAQNDYLRTIYYTVPKGLRGSACEARFKYTGGDALNYSAKVETESGVVLGTFLSQAGTNVLPIHSIAGYESIFFKCPTEADVTALSTNGNVRLVIYQGTVTDAAAMTADDVHFGGLIGLVETSIPDVMTATIEANGTVSSESSDFINGNCVVTSTSVSTCSFNSGIFTVAPSCVVSNYSTNGITNLNAALSTTTMVTRSANNSNVATAMQWQVSCSKQGADAKQSVQVYKSIPKISENINEFSARSSNAGVVSGENTNWISGDFTFSPTGVATATLVSDVFTSSPNCVCSVEDAPTTDRSCSIQTASTSSLVIRTTTTNALANNAFQINCQKSGDFKLPTVQPIIIGQVTNSASESALKNVRVEACRVSNSGTAALDTAYGLCESWIQSVSRTGAGNVSYTLKSGIFSMPPVCTLTGDGGVSLSGSKVQVTSTTNVVGITMQNNTTGLDAAQFIVCQGVR